MSKLEEKKRSSTEYYRNPFLYIHEDDVSLPAGISIVSNPNG